MKTLEGKLTDFVSGVMPWLAPVPCAFLIGRACLMSLGWPWPVALVAAVIIECLGLSASITALELWNYNAGKKKTDPGAPSVIAFVVVGFYVVIALVLIVVLDIFDQASRIAPAFFPLLSLSGMTILALRADHHRRLSSVQSEKDARRLERQAARLGRSGGELVETYKIDEKSRVVGILREGRRAAIERRKERLMDVIERDPSVTIADAARLAGIARATAHTYLRDLETAGVVHKNGNGWEVQKS